MMSRAEAIEAAVSTLASFYAPERIYLIGSSARGDAHPGSDLDFLIVLPDDAPRHLFWGGEAYQRLWRIPFAVEIVPFRRSTFERRAGWLMSLPAVALREGILVYESGQRAA